jgi:hypothetical protein
VVDLSEFYEDIKKPCLFTRATKDLHDDDKEKLTAAIQETEITTSSIDKWLQLRNIKVSWPTIRRHRKGECDCG